MSYKTYINDTQVFGNNEGYPEWIEYIKSKGIKVSEEYCYDGYLDDFMEALAVIEKITLRIESDIRKRNRAILLQAQSNPDLLEKQLQDIQERFPKSSWDFSGYYDEVTDSKNKYKPMLFDKIMECVNHGYMFLPYQFFKACEDNLERVFDIPAPEPGCDTNMRFMYYKLKPDCKIHVQAG